MLNKLKKVLVLGSGLAAAAAVAMFNPNTGRNLSKRRSQAEEDRRRRLRAVRSGGSEIAAHNAKVEEAKRAKLQARLDNPQPRRKP